MSKYDAISALWVIWGLALMASYIWLEFFSYGAISSRVSQRLKGSVISRLYPTLGAIRDVTSQSEFEDYEKYRVSYQRWWKWGCVATSLTLFAVTAVVW